MTNAWRYQHRRVSLDRVSLPIEFDACVVFALQNDIDLGLLPVKVHLRILADLRQMHGAREFVSIAKRAAGNTTWARHTRQLAQIDDFGG